MKMHIHVCLVCSLVDIPEFVMFVEYQTVQILVSLFECFYYSAQFVSILTLSSYFSLTVLSHLITNITILVNI